MPRRVRPLRTFRFASRKCRGSAIPRRGESQSVVSWLRLQSSLRDHPMPPLQRRTPRDGERRWQGHNVDVNLTDDWLLPLNGLSAFRLVSICEGHLETGSGRASAPHVNLRLKAEFVQLACASWDDLSIGLAGELGRHFQTEDTHAEVELRRRVATGRDGVASCSDLVIRLRSQRSRSKIEMEPEVTTWFGSVVEKCQSLDRFICRRLGVADRHAA